MQHNVESIFSVEFNRISLRFESLCKTVLGHESGDPGVQFQKKTEGRKSREAVPLISFRFVKGQISHCFVNSF
jgi:hypothetical protein